MQRSWKPCASAGTVAALVSSLELVSNSVGGPPNLNCFFVSLT
jgi:hypothetical protein